MDSCASFSLVFRPRLRLASRSGRRLRPICPAALRPIRRLALAQPGASRPILGQAFPVGAGISVWGGKGVKGGVGGETDLTYEHVFDNGIMLRGCRPRRAICRISSRAPISSLSSREALSAGGSAIMGYNFGQVTPYVITGVDFVTHDPVQRRRGSTPAMQSTASSPARAQCRAVGTFGVGVNYRITSNFGMGVEAIVHTNPGSGSILRRGRNRRLARAGLSWGSKTANRPT